MTICVRKREKNGHAMYNYEKRYSVSGERIQEMHTISAKDYLELCKNKADDRTSLQKKRTCFVYKTQSFVLETYVNVPGKPCVLRVETNNDVVDLPPFINIDREITGNRSFSSAKIAEIKQPTL